LRPGPKDERARGETLAPGRPLFDKEKAWQPLLSAAVLGVEFNRMLELTIGCLKWAAVGFIVAFFLMRMYEASHIHDDIPRPEFKKRQSKRAALVLSTFAAMLSALVWLLVQKWD
jgi:hypothetical protein